MGPDKTVPPSELFLKLIEAPRPTEVINYPRKDPATGEPIGKIRMQVLTQEEHDRARIAAHRNIRTTLPALRFRKCLGTRWRGSC